MTISAPTEIAKTQITPYLSVAFFGFFLPQRAAAAFLAAELRSAGVLAYGATEEEARANAEAIADRIRGGRVGVSSSPNKT